MTLHHTHITLEERERILHHLVNLTADSILAEDWYTAAVIINDAHVRDSWLVLFKAQDIPSIQPDDAKERIVSGFSRLGELGCPAATTIFAVSAWIAGMELAARSDPNDPVSEAMFVAVMKAGHTAAVDGYKMYPTYPALGLLATMPPQAIPSIVDELPSLREVAEAWLSDETRGAFLADPSEEDRP